MAALKIYRTARWLHVRGVPLLPKLLYVVNRMAFGVVLPPSAELGYGVVLGYQGLGIVIHEACVIGNRVTIGTGVTIGGRSGHARVPRVGNDVLIGSGAKVLGPITIGDRARIGANAVVIRDVPAGALAVGVPSRIKSQLVD